jgi:hypothetical protein
MERDSMSVGTSMASAPTEGVGQMLMAPVETEVAAFLAAHADLVDQEDRAPPGPERARAEAQNPDRHWSS